MKTNLVSLNTSFRITPLALAALALLALNVASFAYSRYRNPSTDAGWCSGCHGDFTGSTSPKNTEFPSGDKHEMHRAGTSMATACNLCHTSGDGRNPYTYTSTGTANNRGLGCAGCHVGPGLRRHHAASGVTTCYTCHTNDATITVSGESTAPPYYGTADTRANNPCNKVAAANTNENWSIGDFLGLDNDGNNVYDALDPACTPYRIVQVAPTNTNVRVTWETAGGRTDVLQASGTVTGAFVDVSSPINITGTGLKTNTYVEVGGGTNQPTRFYRLRMIP
jgi:hypothetical protein